MKLLIIRKKLSKRLLWTATLIFVFMNMVAIFHSYKFTHFTDKEIDKTNSPIKLTTAEKIKTLILGVNNPRPANNKTPIQEYETIKLRSNREIECWNIKTDNPKGSVILFHGFSGHKSTMLDKAAIFQKFGYNTLLVDFMGAGGSEGNQSTIGFLEAEQVKTCFDYLINQGEKNIYLFGTSMGAAAIMKAINDHQFSPKGIIIECPFGSMYETVCARFNTMNTPTFPMASLLVFWGGLQNGFWAFGHNPREYSKNITCPTLLLYGEQDKKVNRKEIDEIYANLNAKKILKTFPQAGHENYLTKYKSKWKEYIEAFLNTEQIP
ncbi:alpha/beta hydrolase [Marinilabiliaceae bacterium JC017]|nr:alpha/beta hydrolase [Marinilabiliaceae bacterium JC017]